MAKTYIHVMQNDASQRKPKLCRGCPMAKTYIYVMQMPPYSKNLNHEEVARRRKPKPMFMQNKSPAK